MFNPKPLLAVAGVATALVFAVLYGWERAVSRDHAAALDVARARITTLQDELAAATARAASPPPPERPEVVPPPPPGPPDGERDRPPGRGRRAGELMAYLNDPEVAPLVQKQRQRQVATRYAALIAKLGLAPEQAAKLLEMLADKQLSRSEAQVMARQQGLARSEARDLARQSDAESDTAIKALIGESAFAQLQAYDRTMPQRTAVNGLATQLVATGSPLSFAQQERLVDALAAHATVDAAAGFTALPDGLAFRASGIPTGLLLRGESPEKIQAIIDRQLAGDAAVIEEATQFLDASQLAALRRQQEEQVDQLWLAAKMAERLRRDRTGE